MSDEHNRIISWVATRVMPHEARARAWLRRSSVSVEDINDLIQEAYCKLSALESVDHIEHPGAYFLLIVRNLFNDSLRRSQIIRIEAVQELDALTVLSDEPTPEDITSGRRELERVRGLMAALPRDCRQVIELRKIEGLSQREIATRLRISEARVEHLGVRGMKLLVKALKSAMVWDETTDRRTSDERSRNRRRD